MPILPSAYFSYGRYFSRQFFLQPIFLSQTSNSSLAYCTAFRHTVVLVSKSARRSSLSYHMTIWAIKYLCILVKLKPDSWFMQACFIIFKFLISKIHANFENKVKKKKQLNSSQVALFLPSLRVKTLVLIGKNQTRQMNYWCLLWQWNHNVLL